MISLAPTGIAPFNDIDPAGWITVIGIVIAGEQIAVVVEDQLLWIAQAEGEDFQMRAIQIAAIDCAGIRIVHRASVDQRFGIGAAIAHREIELVIRPDAQAVQIVAEKRDVNAVTGGELLADIGDAVTIRILQQIKGRYVSEIDIAMKRHHARRQTRFHGIEAGGKDRRLVGLAGSLAVPDQPNAIGVIGEMTGVGTHLSLEQIDAIFHTPRGKIVSEPIHVVTNVQHV